MLCYYVEKKTTVFDEVFIQLVFLNIISNQISGFQKVLFNLQSSPL